MAKKKKYYQSPKDRIKESRGMEKSLRGGVKNRSKKGMDQEFLSPQDYKRRGMLEDSQMIREDHNATANLPQQVIMKEYRKVRYGHAMGIDDTITGIDIQMEDDSDEMKKYSYPEKY